MADVKALLDPLRLQTVSDDDLAHDAVDLAAFLLEDARKRESPEERAQAGKIARMMDDPRGKLMTMAMSDQVFRSHRNARIADQLNHLVDQFGVPKYLGNWEQWALWLGSTMGEYIPSVVVPFVVAKLRQETRSVILPSEEEDFRAYVDTRRRQGIRLNLNQLGEAILGEEEATRRLDAYLKLLSRDDVEYISVKISSIFSQINLLAFEQTVDEIKTRLRMLYRTAMQHRFRTAEGKMLPKFVNLDMEEYRDLAMTIAAFTQTLDEPEFLHLRAGIVLQAYLPDAFPAQQHLTEWAVKRVARGGATIKIRIVKGANLAMERVEAALHGWEQAPYRSKPEVDANYKRMLIYGLREHRAAAVNLGIASHNLFDVAYGILLRAKYSAEAYAEFEMLEGMANHQARAVKDLTNGLLLYAPVVKRDDFHSAIAYLVRRLDENTSPENFLHDLFGLQVGEERWERQKQAFLEAVAERDQVFAGAQRTQNRNTEQLRFSANVPFDNVADTDWSLTHHLGWIRSHLERAAADLPPLPVFADGRPAQSESAPGYTYSLAGRDSIDAALDTAVAARAAWATQPVALRRDMLLRCAEVLAARRGALIAVMARDCSKTAPEADAEVSEAIDFANYYARGFEHMPGGVAPEPLGTVLVTPPWNFPLAIPCGGVLAALMAGNTVILKPAPEAVLTAWALCDALWGAGIPRDALQFLPTSDDETGRGLVTDLRISAVILTGAYATGRMFKTWQPAMRLLAETSGKNAMIITAMADHDQAIKDLVKSAFGHAGQKCSASSLAIIEAEVYDNPDFLRQLKDAAASLAVGSPFDLTSIIPPVIREPGPDLRRGLTELDPGERWLLEPKNINGNPNLWTPGIRLDVKPESWYRQTECFGPVLGLIRARDLSEAIDIVNAGAFGLTSGLQTLDDREIEIWRERIEAGNLYINRGTTGAIVQRQPFGGWKKSVFGVAKAGGPNYVWSLCHWHETALPSAVDELAGAAVPALNAAVEWCAAHDRMAEIERLQAAVGSYAQAWRTHFSVAHDPSRILGESNVFRYRPIRDVLIRVRDAAHVVDGMLAALAAQTCGVPCMLSLGPGVVAAVLPGVPMANETDEACAGRLTQFERVRVFGPQPDDVHRAALESHTHLVDGRALTHGRLELRAYLREQSVTQTTHRYGNVSASVA
jgi:RHH-type transcriptional regulator, proline utilization regulon repressor / proline dehydrogenase / delta 1-pyrroline-5-carboxylate dehydrogenase